MLFVAGLELGGDFQRPGIAGGPDWLAGVTFPDRNEAWRERLDATAIATIEAVEGDELRRHGYV